MNLNSKFTQLGTTGLVVTKIGITLFSVLNLDFFRLVYTPFCLHPEATVLEILSLEYLIAVYPFLLIFITYLLVAAYDRQYRLLLHIWRPFKACLPRHLKAWNVRASLIQVFTTFILLTYVKILGVSLKILYLSLSYTFIHNVAGKRVSDGYFTIYNANMKYFSANHVPFAVLSITASFIFILMPLLLLTFYPCGCFQRCLNHCGGRCQPLHAFMDAFQGCYRTNPWDLRSFSAFYLLLRILLVVQWYIFFSNTMLYTSGMLSLTGAAVVAIFQPYKVKIHNTADAVLLLLLGSYFLSYYVNDVNSYKRIASIIEGISIILLFVYFLLLVSWKMLHLKIKALVRTARRIWVSRRSSENSRNGVLIESFEKESDIINYPPLLGLSTSNQNW